ncbi:fructosamine kinase family protein [Pseudaeromonas sp. ZJS20]|uniref:fructosamine kinase family protein n=1 Tax=Pseudaeromonas aegiceratis TaxID=3153928 RepID=UPI00390C5E27
MWHSIANQIADALQRPFVIRRRESLIQDDECRRMLVEDDGLSLFIKLLPRHEAEQLAVEMRGLHCLAQSRTLKIPHPYCCGVAGDHGFLAMEFLPMETGTEQQWFTLGTALADLHESQEQAMYGWDEDNFFLHTPQPNQWQRSWSQFFAEQRIGWQLQLLAEKGVHLMPIDELVDTVRRLLANHQPTPALLHGNLWCGNLGFTAGSGVLFDPACYFGDREVDLAMSELFGSLPDPFYQGYASRWQPPAGHEMRKLAYNLYPLLAHLNRYGEAYRRPVEHHLHQLLAL